MNAFIVEHHERKKHKNTEYNLLSDFSLGWVRWKYGEFHYIFVQSYVIFLWGVIGKSLSFRALRIICEYI